MSDCRIDTVGALAKLDGFVTINGRVYHLQIDRIGEDPKHPETRHRVWIDGEDFLIWARNHSEEQVSDEQSTA